MGMARLVLDWKYFIVGILAIGLREPAKLALSFLISQCTEIYQVKFYGESDWHSYVVSNKWMSASK